MQSTADRHGLRHFYWLAVANRTDILLQRGLPGEAALLSDAWLSSREATQNFWLEMMVRVNAGWAALELGEHATATRRVWEALDRALDLGVRDQVLITVMLLLASVLAPLDAGDRGGCARRMRRALRRARAIAAALRVGAACGSRRPTAGVARR